MKRKLIAAAQPAAEKPKYVLLRTVAFALFFVLAIVFIVRGVVLIGKKEPGLHEVEPSPDEEAPLYAAGILFEHEFTGSSDEIKQQLNALKEIYSAALKRAYKLLDPEQEYTGYTNLATLNRHPGEEITLPAPLYAVLQDACARSASEDSGGYRIFSGALWSEWQQLLYLEQPERFDPARNPEEAERISALAAAAEEDCASLRFLPENKVIFTVSPEYQAFLGKFEVEAPILNLNLLHDAYLLQMVREEVEERGYHAGILTTEGGLIVSFSDYASGEAVMIGEQGGEIAHLGTVSVQPDTVYFQTRAFAAGAAGYYQLEDGSKRHCYFRPETGDYANRINTSLIWQQGAQPAEVVCRTLALHTAEDPAQVTGTNILYTLQTGDRSIYGTKEGKAALTLWENDGYRLS